MKTRIQRSPDEIRSEYLYKPFIDFINNKKDREKRKDIVKIFQARTGFGKTYGSQNILMPELFNSHGVDLIVYAVPNTENIDPVSFKLAGDKHGYIFTSDVFELKSLLTKGGRVVFGATHSYINVKKNRNILEELVKKYKSSWFIEECHSWLGVTELQFYKDVMGYNTPVYQGTLWKLSELVLKNTDLVFGITATPTKQHRGVCGPLKFEVMNKWCEIEDSLFLTKWGTYLEYKGYDMKTVISNHGKSNSIAVIDENNAKSNLRKYIREWHLPNVQDLIKFSKYDKNIVTKLTSMILCGGANNTRLSLHLDNVVEYLIELLLKNNYSTSMQSIAVMRDNQKGFYDLCGNFVKATDDEIIDALNDPDEDAEFLLVNHKGSAGINVHNLTGTCSLKIRDPKTADVTELSRQRIGRLSRLNTGHGNILRDKYNMDLELMLMNYCDDFGVDSHIFYQTLMTSNVFQFRYPSTPRGQWERATEEFDKKYAASKKMVDPVVKSIIFDDNEYCSACGQLLHKDIVNEFDDNFIKFDEFNFDKIKESLKM